MSVALYRPAIVPPDPVEAVTAAHALVAASTLVTAQGVTSADHVYLHAYPVGATEADDQTARPQRFAVVRQRQYAIAQPVESSKIMAVPIEVALYIHLDRPNRRQFLAEADRRVALALTGQKLTLTRSAVRLGISMQTEMAITTDERVNCEMALRGYLAVLEPL